MTLLSINESQYKIDVNMSGIFVKREGERKIIGNWGWQDEHTWNQKTVIHFLKYFKDMDYWKNLKSLDMTMNSASSSCLG